MLCKKFAAIFLALCVFSWVGVGISVPTTHAEEHDAEKGHGYYNQPDEGHEHDNMVFIPAGKFIMGDNKHYDWFFLWAFNIYDGPEHTIYLDAYYIDKYEVTNREYREFVEETGRRMPSGWWDPRFSRPNHPVVGVTWHDAKAYAEWAGKRLPTEAEWEKAARGTDKRIWPWGNEFDKNKCNVWESYSVKIRELSGAAVLSKNIGTRPVTSYENGKSPYGCYNMAGNVWEWCSDNYDPNYYADSPSSNPAGPENGMQKVIRGGSFHYFAHYARCAARYRVPPYTQSTQIGFRCAKSVEKEKQRY